MNTFVCAVLAAMVASSAATNGLLGTTLVGSNLGLGLGGYAPIGYGLGGLAPIGSLGLGYNTLGVNNLGWNNVGWNRGLIGGTILNRGLVAPSIAPYGLGLRANSLLLPQSRIISSAPLIAPYATAPLGLSKTVLWKK